MFNAGMIGFLLDNICVSGLFFGIAILEAKSIGSPLKLLLQYINIFVLGSGINSKRVSCVKSVKFK